MQDLQLLHGARDVLDGHPAAHAVHVVQVDVPAVEALERLGQLLPNALQRGAVGHPRRHELGGDHCSTS